MNLSDAVEMVELVGVLWPSWKPGDLEGTAKEWAGVLVETDRQDAEDAIRILGKLEHYPPALSDILDGAKECKLERIPALYSVPNYQRGHFISFADWLKDVATEDEKAIVKKVGPSLFEKLERA